jgi:YHS domain-containing protein
MHSFLDEKFPISASKAFNLLVNAGETPYFCSENICGSTVEYITDSNGLIYFYTDVDGQKDWYLWNDTFSKKTGIQPLTCEDAFCKSL